MKNLLALVLFLAGSPSFAHSIEPEFCVGNRIVDQYGNVGRVVEVYANHMARITLDEHPGVFTRSTATLGRSYRCVLDLSLNEHLCRDDRVVDQYGNAGTVIEIFSNGVASLALDGYRRKVTRSMNTLGLGIHCDGSHGCRYHD